MRRRLVLLALACAPALAALPAHGQDAPGPGPLLGTDPYAGPAPQQRRGNPLWAIPLRELSTTRERPLFAPTRRPPPQAITQAPPPPAPPTVAAPAVPPFTLIGTLVNERGGFALFLDPASRAVIRLRTGEAHAGWVLRSVSMRDAMLQQDRSTTVMTLPARETEGGATRAARAPRAGGNATVEINLPKGADDSPVDPFSEE